MMRIITGSATGMKLITLAGENTRPTAERTKEAIFSMLQFGLDGRRVLDLFGGSGQMGLEALSRGAAAAVFVDGAKEAVQILRKNAEKTHLEARATILQSDALAYLRSCREQPFDLVFLDPPYAAGLLPAALRLLTERRLLHPHAVIVTESSAAEDVFGTDTELISRFQIQKQSRYGVAYITVLTPSGEEDI